MTLRRICKCFAFFANAKVRIRIYALRTFAFAGAARLQILPCGRSGEICSGREPSVPLGGTVMPRTRNSRAAARLHGTVSSRHGDHAKTADSHTRESALQRRCSAIKKPHLQTRFSLVGVARFELAALRSRTVRATKLRYTPIVVFYCFSSLFIQCCTTLCLVARSAHRRFCCRTDRKSAGTISRCPSFCCRTLMQPKLRYTPELAFSLL